MNQQQKYILYLYNHICNYFQSCAYLQKRANNIDSNKKLLRLIDKKYIHIYVIYLNLNIYNHVKIGVIVLNGNDDDGANSEDDLDDVEPLESSPPPLPDPTLQLDDRPPLANSPLANSPLASPGLPFSSHSTPTIKIPTNSSQETLTKSNIIFWYILHMTYYSSYGKNK